MVGDTPEDAGRLSTGSAVADVAAGVAALEAGLLSAPGRQSSPDEWLELVGGCQELVNRITAVQDVAITRAVRFESVWAEDGTPTWVEHGPGRVALGAVDLVAARTGTSHHQAERRVEQAVRLTGREPRDADDAARPERTGLEGLHQAMREGVLDGYRAAVVAYELEGCPADVAGAVVEALGSHLASEPAAGLRRRTRRILVRISPDLLRQRVERARARTGLQRWADEPGVDVWHGRFPTEDSAAAWAAVDALARRYVTDGVRDTIEQARGKALTDLVTQQADVEVSVLLTVPAEVAPTGLPAAADDSSSVGVPPTTESEAIDDGVPETAPRTPPRAHTVGGAPAEGHLADSPAATGEGASVEVARAGHEVAREGSAPAASVEAARAGHEAAREGSALAASADVSRRRAADRGSEIVQAHGSRPSEPVLVRADWLARHTAAAAKAVCDQASGARTDPDGTLSTDAYRPGERLTALVRARDGRCRFPGCSVAARLCDVDHVRPWPAGPTAAFNLISLCRRHHRTKQAPGWWLRLRPDATAEWADPTGAVRITEPLDALEAVVLPAVVLPAAAEPAPRTADIRELPSSLEEQLDWTLHQHGVVLRQGCRHHLPPPGPLVGRELTSAHPNLPTGPDAAAHDPPPF